MSKMHFLITKDSKTKISCKFPERKLVKMSNIKKIWQCFKF